jgi:hypothetical protein
VTRTVSDLALLLGSFVSVTALAELFGAVNMGTAMTYGELAFAGVLLWVILRD